MMKFIAFSILAFVVIFFSLVGAIFRLSAYEEETFYEGVGTSGNSIEAGLMQEPFGTLIADAAHKFSDEINQENSLTGNKYYPCYRDREKSVSATFWYQRGGLGLSGSPLNMGYSEYKLKFTFTYDGCDINSISAHPTIKNGYYGPALKVAISRVSARVDRTRQPTGCDCCSDPLCLRIDVESELVLYWKGTWSNSPKTLKWTFRICADGYATSTVSEVGR